MIDKLKNAWKSVTIWFNSVMALTVPGLPMLQDSFPQLQPYLPEHVYQYLIVTLIIANILLRFKTTQSLADK